MKRLIGSLTAKTTACVLLFISLGAMILCGIGAIVLAKSDVYFDGGRSFRNTLLDNSAYHYESYLYNYANAFMFPDHYDFDTVSYEDLFNEENCNYFFTLYNNKGDIVLSNYTPASDDAVLRDYGTHTVYGHYVDYSDPLYVAVEPSSDGSEIPRPENVPTNYIFDHSYYDDNGTLCHAYVPEYSDTMTLRSGIRAELTAKDRIYYSAVLADFLINLRYPILLLLPVFLLMCVILVIYLVCAAGHHHGEEHVRLNTLDRIPFDLYLGSIAAIALGIIYISEYVLYDDWWIPILLILAFPLSLAILLTFSTRMKTNTLWSNLLLTRIWRWIVRICKKFGNTARQLPLYWRTLAIWSVYSLAELFFFLKLYEDILILFWVIKTAAATALIVAVVMQMQKLRTAGRELADGNITYTVATDTMLPLFKEHGEHLNGIGEGLKIAVEKGVRSERMRAELITNVSHDIKTPLTSLINYVDLLKIEGLDSENAPAYLEVLDRQSARLKKLTEDLVEASKASTGALRVEISPLNVNILLQQATAEYQDKLSKKKLELVTNYHLENAYIAADGRLLWRVLDNLFSNILKYAKADTRVYVSTQRDNGRVIITFKNISNEALDISADELTERFVRGDASRNTEGSGLGLSIAKSLTELQGGTFDIFIDGDLFKTVIALQETPYGE